MTQTEKANGARDEPVPQSIAAGRLSKWTRDTVRDCLWVGRYQSANFRGSGVGSWWSRSKLTGLC